MAITQVSTRTALAALTPSAGDCAFLTESLREGAFAFNTADLSTNVAADPSQGIYVAPGSDTTGASGAWVRNFDAAVSVKWFGATGDGTTDDSVAVLACLATLKALGVNFDGYYGLGSLRMYLPAGSYNMGTTSLEVSHTLIIEGDSTIIGYGSRLKWTGDCDGIRIEAYNTHGTDQVDSSPFHTSASYTTLRNLALYGPYPDNVDFTGNTESECHGIRVKSNVIIQDCAINGFAGDGVYALTSAGGGGVEEGNSNCSFINRLWVRAVRNGVFLDGADANAWTIIGVIATYCRQHTIWDSSFLGNTHIGHHSANAGLVPGVPASVVSYSSNRYCVVQGQATGASTNAPSGTAFDNTWWLYLEAGGPDSGLNIPTWTSSISVREGGGYRTDNLNARNNFIGCYQEGGEGASQFVSPTLILGGLSGTRDPVTSGNNLAGDFINAPSPSGISLGQTRVSNVSNSLQLALWNNGATAAGIMATLLFEQGFEADGITPLSVGRIRAYHSSTNPALAEGVLLFGTRTYGGGGAYTDWVQISGPSFCFAPVTTNQMDLGLTGLRWKNLWLSGNSSVAGKITSTGPTSGVGYATGAGGAVTQATSKSTGVTLNKVCGKITMNAAALAANTAVSFTITNSTVAATDAISLVLASGNATAGTYSYQIDNVSAGSFVIWVKNISAGSLSEALVFNFGVIKAVSA